jgi:23S rRNA (cytidine1920-2'-O)/16S rRNA (cytidine1409-2'-O)-methyltransferase
VRDRAVHEKVLRDIMGFIPSLGWSVAGLDYSPIRGPEGNIEFLLYLKQYDKSTNFLRDISIDVTITRAYDNFFKSVSGGL